MAASTCISPAVLGNLSSHFKKTASHPEVLDTQRPEKLSSLSCIERALLNCDADNYSAKLLLSAVAKLGTRLSSSTV